MTQVLIDRATLEQLVGALEGVRLCTPPAQRPMVREAITAGRAALTEGGCKESNERNTMNFLELRAAIINLLNKADNLSAEEVYGVVSSVEAEVRLSMFAAMKQAQQKDTL